MIFHCKLNITESAIVFDDLTSNLILNASFDYAPIVDLKHANKRRLSNLENIRHTPLFRLTSARLSDFHDVCIQCS